jgi:uncharacterized membrane protein
MSDKIYVVHAATYGSLADAKTDLEALKLIKSAGEIRDLTAAIVTRTDKGRLKVHEVTHSGKVAAKIGLIGGAMIGALFPPAGVAVLGAAATNAAIGGAVLGAAGHFTGGISRKAMKELGELLDDGEATIVAVAVDAIGTDIAKALSHAEKKASKHIDKGDYDAALKDLEKGIGKAENIAGV